MLGTWGQLPSDRDHVTPQDDEPKTSFEPNEETKRLLERHQARLDAEMGVREALAGAVADLVERFPDHLDVVSSQLEGQANAVQQLRQKKQREERERERLTNGSGKIP